MAEEQLKGVDRFPMCWAWARDDMQNPPNKDLTLKFLARLTMGVYETGTEICKRLDRLIELQEKKM